MEDNLQMGKLMVGEMEGYWNYGSAVNRTKCRMI
jgi:hypothetical protein